MAKGAKPRRLPPEEAFAFWWNGGNRRTFQQVADEFGVHYNTVKLLASQSDWDGRAGELDEEVRRQTDARLAALAANQLVTIAEVSAAVIAKFARRLPRTVRDERGMVVANPDEMQPGEVSVLDFERAAKTLLLVTGHATERTDTAGAGDDTRARLDAALEALERRALEGDPEDAEWAALPAAPPSNVAGEAEVVVEGGGDGGEQAEPATGADGRPEPVDAGGGEREGGDVAAGQGDVLAGGGGAREPVQAHGDGRGDTAGEAAVDG